MAAILLVSFLCATVGHPTMAHAQTGGTGSTLELFVDVGDQRCDDANPGTEGAPLCSIQEAADRAVPGTIVSVKEGTYREMVTVTTSGAPGALIKFVNYGEDHVVIDSPGDACFDLRGVAYIKIHGFELTGAWPNGGESTGARHTEVITPAHGGGIRGYPRSEDGFGVQNSVFAYNVIRDNDAGVWLVRSDHNLIIDNVIYNSGEAPIRIKRGENNRIVNNLTFQNGSKEKWGITFYGAPGTEVAHNTVVEPSGGAVYIYEGTSNLGGSEPGSAAFCVPSSNSAVHDNIGVVGGAAVTHTAPLVIGSSTTTDRDPILDTLYGPVSNTYHHNLWYNQGEDGVTVSWGDFGEQTTFEPYGLLTLEAFQVKEEGYGRGSMVADPLFVNPGAGDFRLAADSPARGAASDGGDLGVDFNALPSFEFRPPLRPERQPWPEVPIVLVSRNRLETLDNIHIGPPLDVLGRERTPGGRLLLWRPDGSVTDLTAGTSIYDVQQPDVSFDGRRVVFSGVEEAGAQWHLYEIGLDGTGLRQLTFDDRDIPIPDDPRAPGRNQRVFGRFGDFGPAYLPDGRIMFVSTRYMTLSGSCGHRGQNLYVLDPDSGEMHRRTTERSGGIDPAVLSDGTVIFSHWIDAMNAPAPDGPGLRPLETDYNFAPSFWGIWAMNPDGTGAHRYAFLRGGLEDGGGAYQPHELPDGDLIVTFRGAGALLGHTLANGITRIEPGLVEPYDLTFLGDPYNLEGPHALAPAPLPDGGVVCSYAPTATVDVDWRGRTTAAYDFGLYVVDEALETLTPLYNQPDTDELDAVAVYTRSAPIIPDCPKADLVSDDPTVELGTTATMINHNVYADLPLDVVELPSPKAGSVSRLDVYDDSQTFTTSESFPLLRKQMPRFVDSFPVDEHGAFTATVPADRALLFVLVNEDGVAVRSPLSLAKPEGLGSWVTHSFNGHDYLRPDDAISCSGCHKGHMMEPDLAMEAQANLARLAVATASSEPVPFYAGGWRANDVRLAEPDGRYAWATDEGVGGWMQLDWPMDIEAHQAVLYPLTAHGCQVEGGTLTLSDGASYDVGRLPEDGSPLVIPFDPPRTIFWARFTVDEAESDIVGLAEFAVNGPPDVALPDIPPAAPTNLTTTQGVVFLEWEGVVDPSLAGYRLTYGTAPGEYTTSVDVGNVSWFLMRDLLEDGVTYYITARSYNVHGTESVSASNEVSATVRAPVVTAIEPDHGPIGGSTPITITGQHFAPRGVRVSLGGQHAFTVQVVDDQMIRAVTHWHRPGVVDVVVSNPDDLFGVLPEGFTYEMPDPPQAFLPLMIKDG